MEIGLSKKVGSSEAKQAQLPINLFKRRLFWNNPPPFGIQGAEQCRLIDIDEYGIEIQCANQKYAHGAVGLRVVKPGHYSKDTKLTIILGIEAGDPQLQPGGAVLGSYKRQEQLLLISMTS